MIVLHLLRNKASVYLDQMLSCADVPSFVFSGANTIATESRQNEYLIRTPNDCNSSWKEMFL